MQQFKYKTLNNKITFIVNSNIILARDIICDYKICSDLCKTSCKNFNNKYSCPPHSKAFEFYIKEFKYFIVNILKIDTSELMPIYNSIRMANVIAKSIQKKAFNYIDNNFRLRTPFSLLENGSCRLCKKCKLQDNLPCKYPEKMRPSLEATGIDVNDLVNKSFGFELQWYKKNKFPEYQCVVGGVVTNEPEIIQNELFLFYERNYENHPSSSCTFQS